MRRDFSVNFADRLFSALSYLSAGWVGLGYCIFLYVTKKQIRSFVKFNVTQSIFFALLFFILSIALDIILGILSHIPLIQIIVAWIQLILFRPFIWHYSLLGAFITCLTIYFVVLCLLGKKPYIYKVSRMLDR